jgi:hypothetical protein
MNPTKRAAIHWPSFEIPPENDLPWAAGADRPEASEAVTSWLPQQVVEAYFLLAEEIEDVARDLRHDSADYYEHERYSVGQSHSVYADKLEQVALALRDRLAVDHVAPAAAGESGIPLCPHGLVIASRDDGPDDPHTPLCPCCGRVVAGDVEEEEESQLCVVCAAATGAEREGLAAELERECWRLDEQPPRRCPADYPVEYGGHPPESRWCLYCRAAAALRARPGEPYGAALVREFILSLTSHDWGFLLVSMPDGAMNPDGTPFDFDAHNDDGVEPLSFEAPSKRDYTGTHSPQAYLLKVAERFLATRQIGE